MWEKCSGRCAVISAVALLALIFVLACGSDRTIRTNTGTPDSSDYWKGSGYYCDRDATKTHSNTRARNSHPLCGKC